MTSFPRIISLTLTRSCNLRCKMCGQRGRNGYYSGFRGHQHLSLAVLKKIIKEISGHKGAIILLRGGEPFLYPGIIGLLSYIKKLGVSVSIDTNGTVLGKYARDIVNIGVDNINVSIDGPEKVHDSVRGAAGSFERIKKGILKIREFEKKKRKPSCVGCIVFTISPGSYRGLGDMPEVARSLGVNKIAVIPYYYFNAKTGLKYERLMKSEFSCAARSWKGFFHEGSGVIFGILAGELKRLRKNLKDVKLLPFMKMSGSGYRKWFDSSKPGPLRARCRNPEKLVDIQPDGGVNFCVDLPDYTIGNIKNQSIVALWNNSRAKNFRDFIKRRSLPVCGRCGARYI